VDCLQDREPCCPPEEMYVFRSELPPRLALQRFSKLSVVMQICFVSSYLLRYFPTGIALLLPPPWKAPISLVGISILIVLAVFQFTAKLKLRINQSCVYFCSASGVFFLQTIYCSSQQHRAGETYASERCAQLRYCLMNTPWFSPLYFPDFCMFPTSDSIWTNIVSLFHSWQKYY
jgi:hypothetical protein